MASGNMIVTLVAQTRKWTSGLQRAGSDTMTFGKVASRGFQMGAAALIGLVASLSRAIPALANMGAESRKADIQLRFMLENMNGISASTDMTIKRMDKYATSVSKATGVDDEQIKAVQKKLLMFSSLRKTSDKLNGTFDRTTKLAMDLASAGFGNMEDNATKLGRALEDPAHKLNILARAGVIFTNQEKQKIIALQESGQQFKAQEIILGALEKRVGGLAEKSATPFEKMNQQLLEIGDTIGLAMLPELESMNTQVSEWLSTPQGQKDVKAIADAFISAAYGVKEMAKFLAIVRDLLDQIKPFTDLLDKLARVVFPTVGLVNQIPALVGGGVSGGNQSAPGGRRTANSAPIINFNTPIDSVSAGREVARVLQDYNRANGGR